MSACVHGIPQFEAPPILLAGNLAAQKPDECEREPGLSNRCLIRHHFDLRPLRLSGISICIKRLEWG